MDISVHDNRLLSYCVNNDTREIRLHTVYEDGEPQEHTDVVFSGVAAYHFEQDNFGTIIFDIRAAEAAAIYAGDKERFKTGQKYGWPGVWNTSETAALAYLLAQGVKGFVLSSSYGMNGWVLARSMSAVKTQALEDGAKSGSKQ